MEFLYRLVDEIKKCVVGYEHHIGGMIYHTYDSDDPKNIPDLHKAMKKGIKVTPIAFDLDWNNDEQVANYADNIYYIPYTRKDMFTGIEMDGMKLFQRDRGRQIIDGNIFDDTVHYVNGCFFIGSMPLSYWTSIACGQKEIIGIEGVDK